MARGDYINVTFKTGVGIAATKVIAGRAGSEVAFTVDRTWVIVEELDRSGKLIDKAQFAAGEVVSIVTGHERIATARKKK